MVPAVLVAVAQCLLLAQGQVVEPPRPDDRIGVSLPPRIRVAPKDLPIELRSLDVRVRIDGLQAITTETLTFFNPNPRVLEGELLFPLPDGATVSGYGIDVEGTVVDATVVESQRARVAFETEVRKGADPGLVEQVRGNVYRTRVYPIPARGTRTVRLRWVSALATRGLEAAYHLPLPYENGAPEGSLRVEVAKGLARPEVKGGFGTAVLSEWEDLWVAETRFPAATVGSDLLVRLPKLPAGIVAVEPAPDGTGWFLLSGLVPEAPRKASAPPARLAVAWDASGSRRKEQTDRELAFLERLLAGWKKTVVDLVVFRDRAEPVRSYPPHAHAQLLADLRSSPPDGGTTLAAIDFSTAPVPGDEMWLLLSDGIATLDERMPGLGAIPVWTASGASLSDRRRLRHVATSTGAGFLDLVTLDPADAATDLTSPRPRLARAAGKAGSVVDVQVGSGSDRGRYVVTGRLLGKEGEVTLVFVQGARTLEKRTVRVPQARAARPAAAPGPVAIGWAQARAEELAAVSADGSPELVELGRRYGLVTAGTSLLVLETLAQHLEHGVEPAPDRPALRAQYLAAVGARSVDEKGKQKGALEGLVKRWQERVDWWGKDFTVPPGWRFKEPREALDSGGIVARSTERMAAPRTSSAMGARDGAPPPPAAPGVADATIVVAPWNPQTPWLAPLRAAPRGEAYTAYLAQRATYASPAFYLDCAEFLLRNGERELGLRVLGNLAELRLDDPALLRVLAWRLSQAGALDEAIVILEQVRRLRPEEPHSRRDLALVLSDRAEKLGRPADAGRAVALLWEVAQQPGTRFPDLDLIALLELNRILAIAERRGWRDVAAAPEIDVRLKKLLDLDLRVSLTWDADMTDVDLHVVEPTDERAFYGHPSTHIGGRVTRDVTTGYGPEDYMIHRALPGKYAIQVHYYGSRQQKVVGPATITATIFTNFGRPNERREVMTVRLDAPRDMAPVGVVTIGGSP